MDKVSARGARMNAAPMGDNFGMTKPVLDVVCLCAAWCGTCGAYAETFAELQAALPGHRYRWIDIEDEADLVGDIDVETFPTLLLAFEGHVLFAGPVLPRLGDAQRLVEVQALSAVRGGLSASAGLTPDQQVAYARLAQQLMP
jgi:thioredoxin 1